MAIPNPEVLLADPRLKIGYGKTSEVLALGLQPSMLATRSGVLVVQGQQPERATKGIFPFVLKTVVSRDGGASWQPCPARSSERGMNMEGGAIHLRDGRILVLDTYVHPGNAPDVGIGQRYVSTDDWQTLAGPEEITFRLPGVNFHASTGDDGSPHTAVRLHRRILELPNGDLLTTLYGWFEGDSEPAGYMPTMKKMRVVLLRSNNGGRHWAMVSTIAAQPAPGTEGYCEAVLVRVSQGTHSGRLLCHMRTGQELRGCFSDDEGATWSPAQPRVFAGIDVHRTENWVEQFREVRDKHGRLIADNPVELIGAVVDPDLLELGNGVLVAAFGVRVPPRSCWPRHEHPWNGNYLAFSLDGGDSWSHVERITSGVGTTHYMAIELLPGGDRFYLTWDYGFWDTTDTRGIRGRAVRVTKTD